MAFKVIPTRDCDAQACLDFLASDTLAYEHLDWLSAQDRLFDLLSFALFEDHTIKAILSLSADIQKTAWISFFDALRDGNHANYLHYTYAHIQALLKSYAIESVFLLDLRPWLTLLAKTLGFTVQDEVISFAYSPAEVPAFFLSPGISVRPMQTADLPAVLAADQASFPPQWQISSRGLVKLLQNGGLHSVLLQEGQLIAYAMHSTYGAFAHLDRIAVLPTHQAQGYGKVLLINQIQKLLQTGVVKLTVNTQASNLPSQRLYRTIGYHETGLPVSVLGHSIH
jgi:ribosomal-protein-alanine N-acetyltransferase